MPELFPVLMVRWVQLRVSLWFAQQVTTNANVVPPDFVQLLLDIQLQTIWEPYIPDWYIGAPLPADVMPCLVLLRLQPAPITV